MRISVLMAMLLSVSIGFLSCQGPSKPNKATQGIVGGPFEMGAYMYIDWPEVIHPIDTSPGWNQAGQKILIKGVVYKRDGQTPAPNVVLYYYHTDVQGYYATAPGLDPRVARHGYIRDWVKTDRQGRYAIYTVRPGPYPNTRIPAHIHPTIKEPDIDKEYYIDDFYFDDDSLLTKQLRREMEERGGNGILTLGERDGIQIGRRDIILGKNIPNYPVR